MMPSAAILPISGEKIYWIQGLPLEFYPKECVRTIWVWFQSHRRFESDVTAVSEAHFKDKYIEELESKLGNCLQEIGFLQDQLNLRNTEVNYLGEQVHSLELKLGEVEKLHEKLRVLRDDALQSDSRCAFLTHVLEQKESDLWKSNMHIEKLEGVISSSSLESQCEIESMKLEVASLEQRCFEAESLCDQVTQEKSRINTLLEEYGTQIQVAQQTIRSLETDNKELQEKLRVSEEGTRMLVQKAQDYLSGWMNGNCGTMTHASRESDRHLLMKHVDDLLFPSELCTCKEVLDPFLSKLAVVTAWDENVKDEMEKMSKQIQESNCLSSQLKEELREEKMRAKEDAEDLAQEMAELRYQVTGMLEEECKRRACIEQASIRRIQELEVQVLKEQRKSLTILKHFHEAQDKAEARSREVHHLKNALKALTHITEPEVSVSTESCSCGTCVFAR
ncbi:hypothetical protein Taro_007900 [Colocasia esculenta]|uniref:Uncharacterized protein n=1 Tax=Colocasia esculenta TaxID=4460 RepID=A0A843U0C8_COLES|nr:hypothetical protein [Colocasia esculenta]